MKRKSFLLFLGIIFILFFAFDLQRFLTLDFVKTQLDTFKQQASDQPILAALIYLTIYIVSVTFSFPGAAVLTLLGGAIFGLWLGTVLVSVASTIGATLAFLGTRWLLGDYVRKKWQQKWKEIEAGFQKEGPFYLLTLRLIPIVPFFLVNILMGVTPIRWTSYVFVSWIGMLPGTMAYVNAGEQLSTLTSLKGILSPSFLGATVVLAILPFLAKSLVANFKNRKLYGPYKRPKKFDFNIIVIGGGSAGLVTSYIAAAVKAKVALIEKHKMGGDCLNTGCVPSKALLRTAKFMAEVRNCKDLGIQSVETHFEFSEVMKRVHHLIAKIEPHDSVERYQGLGVDCIQGEAQIISPFEVKVNGKVLTTKNIVIATGAAPRIPAVPGLSEIPYLTSENLWNLKTLPKKLLVVGGGAIGCEMAQAFTLLGSQVTLVESADRLLRREDPEVSELIQEQFKKQGMDLKLGFKLARFDKNSSSAVLQDPQNKEISVLFDQVLIASGRKSRLDGFGLENLKIETNNGEIVLDPFLRTNYPNIFACGDVIGKYQFTHGAAHEAWFVAVNALFSPLKKFKIHYKAFPWVTYTLPEVARVGLNETEAEEQNISYEVTNYNLAELDRAITDSEAHGFVKVITVKGKDQILGATIVGAHAGDMLPEFVLAMRWGLGLNKILSTIHSYPTLAEANKYAAGMWRKNHAPKTVLNWLEKIHRFRRQGL